MSRALIRWLRRFVAPGVPHKPSRVRLLGREWWFVAGRYRRTVSDGRHYQYTPPIPSEES